MSWTHITASSLLAGLSSSRPRIIRMNILQTTILKLQSSKRRQPNDIDTYIPSDFQLYAMIASLSLPFRIPRAMILKLLSAPPGRLRWCYGQHYTGISINQNHPHISPQPLQKTHPMPESQRQIGAYMLGEKACCGAATWYRSLKEWGVVGNASFLSGTMKGPQER